MSSEEIKVRPGVSEYFLKKLLFTQLITPIPNIKLV
jgi:hypothetical protein